LFKRHNAELNGRYLCDRGEIHARCTSESRVPGTMNDPCGRRTCREAQGRGN
jgi:hypothetical protein